MQDCCFQRIRVVGSLGKQWFVDPDPAGVVGEQAWRLWVWERRPLARLQWDPGEWFWRDPFSSPDSPGTPFFQYTARLGRHIQTARIGGTPAAAEHWRRQGLSGEFLSDFWARLWSSQRARRITMFIWMVAHRGTAVGVWLVYSGLPETCPCCGHDRETQRHCIWDCPSAQQVWGRVLRLMTRGTEQRTYTWGAVAWSTDSGPALSYETEPHSTAICSQGGRTTVVQAPDYSSQRWCSERPQRWELISSIAAWSIWRARCTRAFEGRGTPAAETVRDFWTELIHTLRGQFEQLAGSSDRMQRRREAFLRLWRDGPFYTESGGALRWQYRPPVWLFPPPPPPPFSEIS